MPSRNSLLRAIRVLLLVNVILLQQFIPALSISGLPDQTASNDKPVISIKGYANQAGNYVAGKPIQNCGTTSSANQVSFEWKLTNNPQAPITYTHNLYGTPSGVSHNIASTPDPYFMMDLPVNGTYIVSIYAVDGNNKKSETKYCSVIKDTNAPVIDTTNPVISWINPVNNQTVSGFVTLSGQASDSQSGISWVRFSYKTSGASDSNYMPLTQINTAPYQYSVNTTQVPDGCYTLRMIAQDGAGNQSVKTINVKVANGQISDTTKPTIDLVFPEPIGETGKWLKAVFSEPVKQNEAENPANYFLHNWPTAASYDNGNLVGKATISYDAGTRTATISFPRIGWWIAPEQQWGVENIHDLAGNLLQVNPYTEYSTPLIAPTTTLNGVDGNWHQTAVTGTLACNDGAISSGCHQTFYKINGGNTVEGKSFTITDEGIYTISYYSNDWAGNTEATKTAQVKIDKTAPVVSVPADQIFEATSSSGYYYGFVATATDNLSNQLTVTCNPGNIGFLYPVGTTKVTCSATDAAGNTGSASLNVTVTNNGIPVINIPADKIVEATAIWGAVVNYRDVTAINPDGSKVNAVCSPESGSKFAFDDTIVVCSVKNGQGNTIATANFKITVRDTVKPEVMVPAGINVNTNNTSGVEVTYTVTALDNIDGTLNTNCNKASGSLFSPGVTFVSCSASDAHGNSNYAIFSVTVNYVAPAVTTVTPTAAVVQQQIIVTATPTPTATLPLIIAEPGKVFGTETNTVTTLLNQSCSTQYSASGYVFIDKNGNNSKNTSELIAANVEVIVYIDNTDIATIKTDASGLWSTKLCSGDYKLKVNNNTLPANTKIAQDNLELTVRPNSGNENNNIALVETAGNYWWILICPVLIVLFGGLGIFFYRKYRAA